MSFKSLFFFLILFLVPTMLLAQSSYIEVIAPGNRQLKFVVDVPRTTDSNPSTPVATEIGQVIAFDINMSGIAAVTVRDPLSSPRGPSLSATDLTAWMNSGCDLLVRSEYSVSGDDLTVEFRLYDAPNRKLMVSKRYLGKKSDLRRFAHLFSDEVMLVMTGERGCFTTHIAFVTTRSRNKEIAIMDWDGHNQIQLTKNGAINLNPDFSPDGREIVYTSYKRGRPELFKRALSRPAEIPVSTRNGLNITGAWSPNGSKIALSLSKDGNSEIYTIARDGSNPVRLTSNPAIDVSPVWSPDGSQIAFVSDRLGKPQIFIMNADGSGVRRLTTNGAYNVNPRWSPKGDKIVYTRMQGGFQIYIINVNGGNDMQLSTSGSSENPAWSPDGRFIAYSSQNGIYVMRADGSGQTRISRGKGSETQPAWQPR